MAKRNEKFDGGRLTAAVDLSSDELCFAVATALGQSVLLEERRPARGRECSTLVTWLRDQLDSVGATFRDVREWTLGTGPGSFTGLRMTAATVLGITHGRPATRVHGVPSGLAMAAELESEQGERVGVVFRGRRDHVTMVFFKKMDDALVQVGEPRISRLDKLEATARTAFRLVALTKDRAAIENACSGLPTERFHFLEAFPARRLLSLGRGSDDRDELMNLNYLRPATTARP